ncbi:MAG: chemotaxis protein CheX [Methylotenera sp.]|nr:chemotaxis protein CheX [Oligoflexia bacterium]
MSSNADELVSKKPFQVLPSDGYTTLKLIGTLPYEVGKEFTEALAQLVTSSTFIVVNCEHLNGLPAAWLRSLTQLATQLKPSDKKICLIMVKPELKKAVEAQSVQNLVHIAGTLKEALSLFGMNKARTVDVNFIKPFVMGAQNVLKIQASTESKPGKPYSAHSRDKFPGDISGVIGLVSDAFTGAVVISFPGETFLKIMSRMLGEEFKVLTPEIQDGAGELTNIIFGQAKIALNESGYGIKTAIPSVVSGPGHSISGTGQGPRVVIPFETDCGQFFIQICLSD